MSTDRATELELSKAASHMAPTSQPIARDRFTRDDIAAAYRLLLGREAENEAALQEHLKNRSLAELLSGFISSPEFRTRMRQNHPFEFFASTLDARAIISAHDYPARAAKPGHIVNYLGVATSTSYISALAGKEGVLEEPPIPSNFHAEMIEWAAALRAVDLARDTFTVIELGAGWGCWMVNTAVAAKRRGLAVKAIGVEGDPGHVAFLEEHCTFNGLDPSEYAVYEAVAGAKRGIALFPHSSDSSAAYGQEPRFFDSRAEAMSYAKGIQGQVFDAIPVAPLSELAADLERVDLLHIDIQGGETDLVAGSLSTLKEKVAYIVIGTHSRAIDGDLLRLLLAEGWRLEFEKPATFEIKDDGQLLTILDGTQGWRNPNLTPALRTADSGLRRRT